jgi:hypothetical protein
LIGPGRIVDVGGGEVDVIRPPVTVAM